MKVLEHLYLKSEQGTYFVIRPSLIKLSATIPNCAATEPAEKRGGKWHSN